jgi:purine-binding chemotaxis protein CheW
VATVGERQFVLFRLENNIFGIPISNVQEIIQIPSVTTIPNTPEFFKGIVNLRGKVIPVLGLGEKLGLRESESEERRIIIINAGVNTAGIVVDAVWDVLKIAEDSIETGVKLCASASRAISGIAKIKDQLVILLNLEQLLVTDDIFNFEEIYGAIEEHYRLNS